MHAYGRFTQPPNLEHGAQGYLASLSPQIIHVKIYVVSTIYSLLLDTAIFISISVRNLSVSKDRKPQCKLSKSHNWKSSRTRQTLKQVLRAPGAHTLRRLSLFWLYPPASTRVLARWLHRSCPSWPQGLITAWMLHQSTLTGCDCESCAHQNQQGTWDHY